MFRVSVFSISDQIRNTGPLSGKQRISLRSAVDSLVFLVLAFGGTIPVNSLMQAIVTQWMVKSAYEALATPLTCKVVGFLKHREGLDVYDCKTRFNPFLMAD